MLTLLTPESVRSRALIRSFTPPPSVFAVFNSKVRFALFSTRLLLTFKVPGLVPGVTFAPVSAVTRPTMLPAPARVLPLPMVSGLTSVLTFRTAPAFTSTSALFAMEALV